MYFRIIFKKDPDYKYVVETYKENIGLIALDEARKSAGCNFDAKFLDEQISDYRRHQIDFYLNEEQVRQTGLFLQESTERVIVSSNLNKFLNKSLQVQRDSNNDAITRVYYTYTLDEKAVFQAWLEAGCPLQWNV